MCENPKPSKSGKFLTTEEWDAFKSAGYSEEDLQADQPLGPMIFSYTRKQAIEDGVLVDVTDLAQQAGFRLHTVVTCSVLAEVTCGSEHPGFRGASVLAVLQTLRECIRCQDANGKKDEIHFEVADWKLWALVGPGDDAEPVLTIMLEGED